MLRPLNKKKESRKREDAIAKKFDGKRVVASGALWFQKGDARTDVFLVEDKFVHEAEFYTLSWSTLHKIHKQAAFHRKVPVFTFGKLGNSGYVIVSDFYLVEDIVNMGKYNSDNFHGNKSLRFIFKELDDMFRIFDIVRVIFRDTENNIKLYYMMPDQFFDTNWKKIIIA